MEDNSYKIIPSGQFKKDYKKYKTNSNQVAKIEQVLSLLKEGGVKNIPQTMKPHFLKGNYARHLECHIEPDLLIIWLQYDEETKEIYLVRLGSHSELFGK